ncbi:MAG TPA: competence/damage-inducible protein A [Thermoanaerobaculia bacterium]
MPPLTRLQRSAAVLAVGSELLGTERLDTNSLRLTAAFEAHGFELRRKAVVGDSEEEIGRELRALLGRVELIVVTGGLGPTADDVTREAVAAALGRRLAFDEAVLRRIEARFCDHGLRMPEVNKRQAEVIEGAELLANARGTAPGMRLEAEGTTLFLLPGVPFELEAMVAADLEPWLAARTGGAGRETAVLKVACLPESAVEERITPAYAEFGREAITILAKPGEIRLLATAAGPPAERRARLAAMQERLAELAGDAVFARREEETLEGVVGELLRRAGRTLAVAESCTGGLVAQRVTAVAGSSDYFVGGVVAYTNRLKTELAGVPAELLRAHGAVSEPVAVALAEGARGRLGADYGIGVTGVAGPGGGSEAKPVGTVHISIAGPDGPPGHRRVRFPGDRERVRWQASQLALELLRRRLLADAADSRTVTATTLPVPA